METLERWTGLVQVERACSFWFLVMWLRGRQSSDASFAWTLETDVLRNHELAEGRGSQVGCKVCRVDRGVCLQQGRPMERAPPWARPSEAKRMRPASESRITFRRQLMTANVTLLLRCDCGSQPQSWFYWLFGFPNHIALIK